MLGIVVGCGGNGSGGAQGMTWDDDGTAVKPIGAKATMASTGGSDTYTITGTNLNGGSVVVAMTAATPISAQTFVCGQTTSGQTVGISYIDSDGGINIVEQSCTVVLTQVGKMGGPSVVGTFDAVLTLQAGGTKTISNGKFNLPITM
jgi:hypothetical protein